MVIINLLLIALISVFIVDISGAVDSFKSGLKALLTGGKMRGSDYSLKPLDCSLCTTFWAGIIYLLITENFTIPYIALVCFFAYFSDNFKNTILLVGDMFVYIINGIYKLLDENETGNIR